MVLKNRKQKPYKPDRDTNTVSSSRAAKSFVLTALCISLFLLWVCHLLWTVNTILYNRFGRLMDNIVFGIGTLVLDVIATTRVAIYLNKVWLDSDIDSDHKKYI